MAKRKLKEPASEWVSHFDLPRLEPVMEQVTDVFKAFHVPLDDLFTLFDPEVQPKLRELALKLGVGYIVCFENLDLSSSHLGHRSAVAAGTPDEKNPGRWTLEFVLQTPHVRLGSIEGRFQHPVCYASTEALQRAEKQLNLSLEARAA